MADRFVGVQVKIAGAPEVLVRLALHSLTFEWLSRTKVLAALVRRGAMLVGTADGLAAAVSAESGWREWFAMGFSSEELDEIELWGALADG